MTTKLVQRCCPLDAQFAALFRCTARRMAGGQLSHTSATRSLISRSRVTPPALPPQIKPAQNGLVLQWEHKPAIIPTRIAAPLDEFRPVLESSTAQEAHPSPLTRESA
jgi:hypothetical protein